MANAERLRLLRKERRAKGLCACGNTPKSGSRLCDVCSERLKRARERRKAAGLCPCSRKVTGGYKLCDVCRKRNKGWKERLAAQGLCICKRPLVDGRAACVACLREQYKRNRSALKSGKPLTTKGYLGRLFRLHKKHAAHPSTITVADLHNLWESQCGLCALSRLAMVHQPHSLRSASIDRKDSTKCYTPDNIQLVCKWANLAKNTYSDAELIDVLNEIRGQNVI